MPMNEIVLCIGGFVVMVGIAMNYFLPHEAKQDPISSQETAIARIESKLDKIDKTQTQDQQFLTDMLNACNRLDARMDRVEKQQTQVLTDNDDLQNKYAHLRDQQSELKEKLASKRPVFKFPSPLPVDVVNEELHVTTKPQKKLGKGVGAIMGESHK